jgi:hypothetical protein
MRDPVPAVGDGGGLYDVDAGVTGVFRDPEDVKRAVRRLTAQSVPPDTIRVFLVDEQGRRSREIEVEDEAGALRGGLVGAGLGAILGLLIAILVPVFGGGAGVGGLGMSTLLGTLRVMALCAVAAIPLGVIIGMGRWPGRRRIEETGLRPHRIHITVESEALAPRAREVLEAAGAERVDRHAGRSD